MYSLDNMQRFSFNQQQVLKLINLYQNKGKEFYYRKIMEDDEQKIVRGNIEVETAYFHKLINSAVTDNRLRLLVTKDSNPKNNEEKLIANAKFILETTTKKGSKFSLATNALLGLVDRLYSGIKKVTISKQVIEVSNGLFTDKKEISLRSKLDDLFSRYENLLSTNQYEQVSLAINFYIDFINIKCFGEDTQIIGILLLHVLLVRSGFEVFRYTSFLRIIAENQEEFRSLTVKASYNWEDGFARTEPLTDYMIDEILKNYDELKKIAQDYEYDQRLNKTDNIENTIYKLPQIFSKEDIRAKHPFVSDSTINRTLQRLRDEGKISPMSTGRGAKWLRVTEMQEQFNLDQYGQMNIFELSGIDD